MYFNFVNINILAMKNRNHYYTEQKKKWSKPRIQVLSINSIKNGDYPGNSESNTYLGTHVGS